MAGKNIILEYIMGGNTSKSTITQLTDIATDVATKNVQSCVGKASQDQLLLIKGTKGDVKIDNINQRQGATVDMKCLFNTETQDKMQNEMSQKIEGAVKAKGGLFGSKAKQDIDIKNIFKTNINNETVSQQVSSTLQNQAAIIDKTKGSVIIGDVTQEQTATVIAETIVNSSQYTGVLKEIATKVDAKATSESGGIFGSLFGGIGGIVFIVIIVIGLGIGAVKGYPYLQKWIRDKQAAKMMTGSPAGISLPGRSASIAMPILPPPLRT
jgi:hypothetical protein